MKSLIFAVALSLGWSVTAGAAGVSDRDADEAPIVLAQACGWYVISGCYRKWSQANTRSQKIGAYVVNTSSAAYPNFRPGYFCAVFGPYDKSTARSKSRYIKPSYIKNAC